MITIRIQPDDFDVGEEIIALKQAGDAGAVVTFTGVAREDDGVSAITLEHYPGMTEREIARHVEEAQTRWSPLGVTIIHRIGKLAPDDNIVLVVVAARHRQAAFAAAEFLMDYLKTRAPFWKAEQTSNGEKWVQSRISDTTAAARWKEPEQGSDRTIEKFQ
jgi:molybdopterin synthase catalytic subunit